MEKVILLADKNSKAWDFSLKIQKYIQDKKEVSIPLEKVSIEYFRNNEIDMHVPENIRKKDIYFIHDSTKNPQEWWAEILLLKDLSLNASAESLSLILPNMLYSRKDRKEKSRVPVSARALANSISPGLKRIITMDLHANQIQGFYPANVPLDNLYSFPEAVHYLKENHPNNLEELVVVSPDAGGAERAESFAKRLESKYPIALIDKRRIKAGEIEKMRLAGDVYNKDVLIVDDIIDSGGTLCKAAGLLKEKGAKNLSCYATHGLFTKGTKELFENFDSIITSNTHYREKDKVEVVDVSSVFAEAIYRAQKGLSISKLFESH
ncbi:ribose-phosphate pyrophosphokinase [Candidatus Pacearchaeota archaeon]|nr:ribose-phosphate pyrophosphokinase [Candidatus Pacearchaeota archaeon]